MERKRILIAVNTPQELEKLRKMLVDSGYEVKVCTDGVTALALSRSFRPHLIMSELDLAKVDAHHLLRELKSHSATKTTPFVLMSRHRSVDERVHSINLGADDYVTLPLDVREVILRLEIILREIEKLESAPKRVGKGFSGKLYDMGLLDLLQTLEIGKKSCVIKLECGDDEGMVFVIDGRVVDAVHGDLPPLEALFRMFTWIDGAFQVEIRQVERASELDESTEKLVNDGFKYREQWEAFCKRLPPLTTQIRLSENPRNGIVSQDERAILSVMNGQTRMQDLIHKSEFDDLSALKLVAGLYEKGAIEEAPLSDSTNSQNGAGVNSQTIRAGGEHVINLISNFLTPNDKRLNIRNVDRRRAERRSNSDRRNHQRRWDDFVGETNEIHLNKSELLMIRRKLMNGNKK